MATLISESVEMSEEKSMATLIAESVRMSSEKRMATLIAESVEMEEQIVFEGLINSKGWTCEMMQGFGTQVI